MKRSKDKKVVRQNVGLGPEPGPHVPQVEGACNRLGEATTNLLDRLLLLETRLAPILRSKDGQTTEPTDIKCLVPVAASIEFNGGIVLSAVETIDSILERLEL